MFRKELIPLLLDRQLSLAEIARAVQVTPRDAEEDLRHLILSLKHSDYRLRIVPAQCRKCDFTFSAGKLGKPSKCPRCRSTWLSEPRIGLEEKRG